MSKSVKMKFLLFQVQQNLINLAVAMKNQLERITINPEICHGKPCVRGMRWPIEVILDLMGSGMSQDEILEDHPELEEEDILACLNFVKLFMSGHSIKDLA